MISPAVTRGQNKSTETDYIYPRMPFLQFKSHLSMHLLIFGLICFLDVYGKHCIVTLGYINMICLHITMFTID